MIKDRHDGNVLCEFEELNTRLKKFNMHIKAWGYLAVALDSDPYGHSGYALNNVLDIRVISGFVNGLEYNSKDKVDK